MNAAAGVICAAQKTKQTAAGIAAALEAAGLLQSPESVASPWERAVAGLNALVDADVVFHVEPDGHISAPFSDEHIEWDLKARRWVLTRDEDEGLPPLPVEDPCHPCGCPKRFNRHADGCAYSECPSCGAPADVTGQCIPEHRIGCPQAVTP